MPVDFYYRARSASGALVEGSMLAERSEEVAAHLRTRSLVAVAIAEASSLSGRIERVRGLDTSTGAALVVFFRSFAVLLRCGIPVSRAIGVTIEQCRSTRLRETLRDLLAVIEQGHSLSSAMRRHPRHFAPLHVAMVEAGEAGGMLDDVLTRLADLLEKERNMSKKIGSALVYPLIVLSAALLLVVFLIETLLPTFARLYEQLDVAIPWSTRVLLSLGELPQQPFFPVLLTAFTLAVGVLVFAVLRNPALSGALDAARLRLPILGPLQRAMLTARVARTLGSLLACGVDVLRSVEIVVPITGNAAYAAALHELHADLRDGRSIADALERTTLFEPMLLQLARIGEESGTLDAMLLKSAAAYESDVEIASATLGSTIEPVLISFVGVVVGFIVFSVFVPMYSLVGQIH